MTRDDDSHVFMIDFRIAEADGPDDVGRAVYDDTALQDAILGGPDSSGVFELEFERRASSFGEALVGAIADLQRGLPEAELLRVRPDELVTIAAIARRVGRSHESVRLLASGRRGPGAFPPDVGQIDAKTRVWRWHEVASWFERHVGDEPTADADAALVAAVNDVLDLRRVAERAIDSPGAAELLASLLPAQLVARQLPT